MSRASSGPADDAQLPLRVREHVKAVVFDANAYSMAAGPGPGAAPAPNRILRIWLRPFSIPIRLPSAASALRVYSGRPAASAAPRTPPVCTVSQPGGGSLTRPMILQRSVSVIRRLRP